MEPQIECFDASLQDRDPLPVIDTISPQWFVEVDILSLEDKLVDNQWVMEQKLDGVRAMAIVKNHTVEWITGRKGRAPLLSTAIDKRKATEFLSTLDGEWAFDGEFMKDTYHIFDLPLANHHLPIPSLLPSSTFAVRRHVLEVFFDFFSRKLGWDNFPVNHGIRLMWQAVGEEEKRALLQMATEEHSEGVMLKKWSSIYQPAHYAGNMLKAKFVKTGDFVVLKRDVGAKNALLGAYDEDQIPVTFDGEPDVPFTRLFLREVGWVTMIGKPDAQPGQVVEVAYLYATKDRQLYQPRVIRIRDDKLPTECLLSQLVITSKEVLNARRNGSEA